MMRNRLMLCMFLCLLALGSCSVRDSGGSSASTLPELAVTATPLSMPKAGSYYNLDSGVGLVLDGEGSFAMYAGADCVKGTYSAGGDSLIFSTGGEETEALVSGTGLVFEDMEGTFLPVGVAEGFSTLGLMQQRDREYTDKGDGTWQVCDYTLQIAFVYPAEMSAPEGLIGDAAVVWDGAEGYVVGRNVTADFTGDGKTFMDGYMRGAALADFRELYGDSGTWESLMLLNENISGRAASAEGVIVNGSARVYSKCIMYTSTYSDGTVNYICKCFFAPEGDSAAFNALANSVMNMTAVRRK